MRYRDRPCGNITEHDWHSGADAARGGVVNAHVQVVTARSAICRVWRGAPWEAANHLPAATAARQVKGSRYRHRQLDWPGAHEHALPVRPMARALRGTAYLRRRRMVRRRPPAVGRGEPALGR